MSRLSIPVSEKDHTQGDPSSGCTLVEYGDYQCPACGQAYPIVKKLQGHFQDRLSFVFRNFPLSQIHPWAEPAAETAEFGGANGKFWQMHDLLYENQRHLGDALFARLAEDLELSSSKLEEALAEQTYEPRVRADFSSGIRSGVNGTPTFFINGLRHDGPFDFQSLRHAIENSPCI